MKKKRRKNGVCNREGKGQRVDKKGRRKNETRNELKELKGKGMGGKDVVWKD